MQLSMGSTLTAFCNNGCTSDSDDKHSKMEFHLHTSKGGWSAEEGSENYNGDSSRIVLIDC